MKRRSILKSMVGVPGAAALLPAQTAPVEGPARTETPLTPSTGADAVAAPVTRFFTPAQLDALRKLAAVVAPASANLPGAVEAGAPEFLDFLLSQSPAVRQKLYRDGLDVLAKRGVNDASLAPLGEPWTYAGPADPYARFLQEAKSDLLEATHNSREYINAASARSRGAAGMNTYWLPIE